MGWLTFPHFQEGSIGDYSGPQKYIPTLHPLCARSNLTGSSSNLGCTKLEGCAAHSWQAGLSSCRQVDASGLHRQLPNLKPARNAGAL